MFFNASTKEFTLVEIERGDIIVYETGIYKAVVVSARASECFFFLLYIEVERLS